MTVKISVTAYRKILASLGEVEVDFNYQGEKWVAVFEVHSQGTPASGLTGAPENYDPGEGPEVELSYSYMKAEPDAELPEPKLSAKELENLEVQAAEQVEKWD